MKKICISIICICLLQLCGCTNNTESEYYAHDVSIELGKYISENIKLSDDKEIEYEGWLDQDKKCYRVAIQYKEEQVDKYNHAEDYFFFIMDDDIECVYVDYTKEKIGSDRYVWNACDFEAYLEDVTFDENLDLIISLGHAGAGGDLVYCAYVYNDGKYIYTNSFEKIINYKIDRENKHIVSGGSHNQVYEYNGEEFVEQTPD